MDSAFLDKLKNRIAPCASVLRLAHGSVTYQFSCNERQTEHLLAHHGAGFDSTSVSGPNDGVVVRQAITKVLRVFIVKSNLSGF